MSFEPSLPYRLTGRLNVVVWRLPLPRRVLARLSMIVYHNPPMPGELVLRIIKELDAAGVSCWIRGGWGVDALAASQTRVHDDLDLVVDSQMTIRAVEVLGELGFREWYRVDSDAPLFSRVVLRDHDVAGRAVDLQPLDLSTKCVQFTAGAIGGRPVPCMSLESQLATHSRYRKRRHDHRDVALLRKLMLDESPNAAESSGASSRGAGAVADADPGAVATLRKRVAQASGSQPAVLTVSRRLLRRLFQGASTVLIVPVHVADDLRHPSAHEAGMPAHVTVLYPFLRARRIDRKAKEILGSALGEMPAFDFTLNEIRRFPNVVYLAPDPSAPFVALAETVLRHWPDQQPYGGAFDEIVPHVTVAYGDATPGKVAERLPISARAQEVWLMSRIGNRWVRRRRFALVGSPQRPKG